MKKKIKIINILLILFLLIIIVSYLFNITKTIDNYQDYTQYDKINSLYLDNNEPFIYDIFARNNQLVIILENNDINNLKVFIDDNELIIDNKISIGDYLYILFYTININATKNINIKIMYKEKNKNFDIYHIKLDNKIKKIASTTLFKYDYFIVPIYYEYYLKQGIEHIYLYYNGKLEDLKIDKKYFNNNKITIIQWDYPYIKNKIQYAQDGQLNHVYQKYGVLFYEYMLFNDLDEYIKTEDNSTIYDYINKNNLYDTIVFHNKWSETLDKKTPCIDNNECKLPKHINVSCEEFKYGDRSKCIHKMNRFKTTVGLHIMNDNSYIEKPNVLINKNNKLYHFHTWSPQLNNILYRPSNIATMNIIPSIIEFN
jgi:hypothetical protein